MHVKKLLATITTGLTIFTAPANAEVMTGAFVPGNAWNQQAITDLNANLPKSMAFINVFSSFSANWDHLYWQSSKIVNEGMIPLISWMPIDYSRYNDNLLPEIALGNWDNYIDLWGTKLVAWVNSYPQGSQPSVMLRFGHEFNGTWYPYGDSPSWYTAAWQHVHDRFEAAGVNDHIEWVWSANNVNVDAVNDITQYYPGDTYVDWTSIDGYNWGSNFSWSTWDSFSDVFASAYATLVTNYPDKPILIAETGSAEPHDIPDPSWGQNGNNSDAAEDKDVWTANMMSAIETDFPGIRALALFNINKELDWSLTDYGNTGLQGYISGMQSSHFTSEFLTADSGRQIVTLQIEGQTQTLQDVFLTDIAMSAALLASNAIQVSAEQTPLQADVTKLNEEKQQIDAAVAHVASLMAAGNKTELKAARIELAKLRSTHKARKQRLKNEQITQDSLRANAAKIKRKIITRDSQRMRAVSRPLPPINLTKTERMRNGFMNMTTAQKDQFTTLKRSVVNQ